MTRLVIVSNRVPVPRNGEKPAAGGLATALRRGLALRGGIWFGWSGHTAEEPEDKPRVTRSGRIDYAVVDLTSEDLEEYYNGFSNRTLWPLMHYRLDLAEFSRRDLAAYMRVNRRFAAALVDLIEPDDLIWIHDYHLIPLASELRRRGVENRIGYFHHIPWPAADVLMALPRHRELVTALCAYDLVGVQTEADADNLIAYAVRELGGATNGRGFLRMADRGLRVASFPIGIETRDFAKRARRATRSSFLREFEDSLMGRDLVIGVDRLDYSKGVPQRMAAFETFLEKHESFIGKVTYLQVTPKSRSEVPEYIDIQREVSEAAGRINGRFGQVNWTPIRYVNQAYGRTALAGLYRRARVGLVTPFRDGMNLVAKEYVAAQDPDDPGVLVLSRFAGAAAELPTALLVNPYDLDGVASAVEQALCMPQDERVARWRPAFERLAANEVSDWMDRYLRQLSRPSTGLTAWVQDLIDPADRWIRGSTPGASPVPGLRPAALPPGQT